MEKSSNLDALGHLKLHLSGKVVILGIGNTLRSDDGIGSILASRLESKVPHIVYDSSSSPENYLGKIAKEKPDTILFVDTMHMEQKPGEYNIFKKEDIAEHVEAIAAAGDIILVLGAGDIKKVQISCATPSALLTVTFPPSSG